MSSYGAQYNSTHRTAPTLAVRGKDIDGSPQEEDGHITSPTDIHSTVSDDWVVLWKDGVPDTQCSKGESAGTVSILGPASSMTSSTHGDQSGASLKSGPSGGPLEDPTQLAADVRGFLSKKVRDIETAQQLLARVSAVIEHPLTRDWERWSGAGYSLRQIINSASRSRQSYYNWHRDSSPDPNHPRPEDSEKLAAEVKKFVFSGSLDAEKTWALRNRINAVFSNPARKGGDGLALLGPSDKLQEVINKILKLQE